MDKTKTSLMISGLALAANRLLLGHTSEEHDHPVNLAHVVLQVSPRITEVNAAANRNQNHLVCRYGIGSLLLFSLISPQRGMSQIITTFAGGTNTPIVGSLPATSVQLYATDLATDQYGRVYASDGSAGYIINTAGLISPLPSATTFAGPLTVDGAGRVVGSGFNCITALYYPPSGDTSSIAFLQSAANWKIAGTCFVSGRSGDGGPATKALLGNTVGITTDLAGNIFFIDDDGTLPEIREINVQGTISTFVEINTSIYGYPIANCMVTTSDGSIYFLTTSNAGVQLVKVSTTGAIQILKLLPSGPFGAPDDPFFNNSLAVDANDDLYYYSGSSSATETPAVLKMTPSGSIMPVAGGGVLPYKSGAIATNVDVAAVVALTLDRAGSLYIATEGSAPAGLLTLKVTNVGPARASCSYTLNPSSVTVPIGGSVTVSVTPTSSDCGWAASNLPNWLTSTTPGIQYGTGTITLMASATTAYGPASIMIGDQTLMATQSSGKTPSTSPSIQTVLNAASFQPGFASGTWISLNGTNLSTTTRTWQSPDFVGNNLPTMLDSVKVLVNGHAAYVYYISPTQINVLAPDDATIGPVPVQVSNSLGLSNLLTVTKQSFAPSFFTYSPQSGRYAIAEDATSFALVGPAGLLGSSTVTRPAVPGEILTLYATGLGPTLPAYPYGMVIQTPEPLATPITVTVGGISVPVLYAGVVGAGVYQINLSVPSLPAGDAAVAISIAGVQSPATTYISIGSSSAN